MRDTCNTRAAGSRMKPTIAGLVLTYNGERLLKECLASLDFCDAILVVDSCSKDATVSIAEAAGAVVIKRAWEGPAAQFRFALEYLDAHLPTDWIVSLDQDEICTGRLKRRTLLPASASPAAHGTTIAFSCTAAGIRIAFCAASDAAACA